jgi:hypothetical protein
MYYWLDGFTQCLLPLLPSGGVGSNSPLAPFFIIFYADLTKWPDGLTRRRTVPGTELWPTVVRPSGLVPGSSFGYLYADVWFGTWRLVVRRGGVQRVNLK